MAEALNTDKSCRAKFSSSRAVRDRKIEDRVARSVIRAVSIDEIMNDVTLIRSDLSRFSKGTGSGDSAGGLRALRNVRISAGYGASVPTPANNGLSGGRTV